MPNKLATATAANGPMVAAAMNIGASGALVRWCHKPTAASTSNNRNGALLKALPPSTSYDHFKGGRYLIQPRPGAFDTAARKRGVGVATHGSRRKKPPISVNAGPTTHNSAPEIGRAHV